MLSELPLVELRQARHFSQEQLAAKLDVRQPAVAKIEKKRTCISRLCADLLKQWGGNWKFVRIFPMAT
jgi:DNA-binding transcriptional regulator YiaG